MELNELTVESRRFLEAEVAAGVYPSLGLAVEAAVDRLRCDHEWTQAAREGFAELDAGLGVAYDDEALAQRFDSLKRVIQGRGQAAGSDE